MWLYSIIIRIISNNVIAISYTYHIKERTNKITLIYLISSFIIQVLRYRMNTNTRMLFEIIQKRFLSKAKSLPNFLLKLKKDELGHAGSNR